MGKKTKSEIVLRCAKGHEWIEIMMLPMNLSAYASRLQGFSCCPTCSDVHVFMLLGAEYEAAKARIHETQINELEKDVEKEP